MSQLMTLVWKLDQGMQFNWDQAFYDRGGEIIKNRANYRRMCILDYLLSMQLLSNWQFVQAELKLQKSKNTREINDPCRTLE